MYGNLSPEGAVAKISGKEGLRFEGKAKVYDSEESAMAGILSNEIQKEMFWLLDMKDHEVHLV